MGSGWRRAFCNTVPKARREAIFTTNPPPQQQQQSNHSTPPLRCKTTTTDADKKPENDFNLVSPKLQCRTTQKKSHSKSSNYPRSPFSILKNTLRFSRSSCGVCMQSVKTGQRTAIYTAECAHAFHFPCITLYVKKQDALDCPVCGTTWKDVPLLSIHKPSKIQTYQNEEKITVAASNSPKSNTPISSPNFVKKGCVKRYADDEPLISVSPKFNRETGEDLIQEVDEFQGFLVNPISSSDDAFVMNRYSRNVEVCLLPEAAVISVSQFHETYAVVLKVRAPPPPPPPPAMAATAKLGLDAVRRAPIDLVTVLDVSDSMNGAKMQMLKRTMRLVISSLGSADRLSIMAFSAVPKRLMPLVRMTSQGQRAARRMIDRLACGRGSCMGEALREAMKVLEERRERNPVASIILLSDGQDDRFPSDDKMNQRHGSSNVSSTRFAHIQIPVNCPEVGEKAVGFSRKPAEEAFSKCVGGLLSVVVNDLKIQLGFAAGSDPAEITAVYSCNEQPSVFGSDSIRLGNLYAEEERELFVELRVPISTATSHHVFSVSCRHKDPATQEIIYSEDHALLVPRPSESPAIEQLRYAFIASRALAESRRLIEYHDLCRAMQLLTSARALLLQSRSSEHIKGVEAELAEVHWRQFQHNLS